MNERRVIEESLERNEKSGLRRNETEETFVQPQMRFKARNRIERVFDTINEQSYGKVDRNIILTHFKTKLKKKIGYQNYTEYLEQQLPKYLTYNIKNLRNERENEAKSEENTVDEEQRFFIRTDTNFFNPNDKKKDRKANSQSDFYKDYIKKNQSASQAMKLLSEYHVKTHFKGASNFAIVNSHKPTTSLKIFNFSQEATSPELKVKRTASPTMSIKAKKKFPTN